MILTSPVSEMTPEQCDMFYSEDYDGYDVNMFPSLRELLEAYDPDGLGLVTEVQCFVCVAKVIILLCPLTQKAKIFEDEKTAELAAGKAHRAAKSREADERATRKSLPPGVRVTLISGPNDWPGVGYMDLPAPELAGWMK